MWPGPPVVAGAMRVAPTCRAFPASHHSDGADEERRGARRPAQGATGERASRRGYFTRTAGPVTPPAYRTRYSPAPGTATA